MDWDGPVDVVAMNGSNSLRPAGGCLIVAEVAQAHDGSLGTAHAFIEAAARCGADAIKFQTHIAEAESSPEEPWRVQFSMQDATRQDYWRRTAFSESHWVGLKEHALERGLLFLSSPFSPEAVEMLSRVGVAAWKVASGEVTSSDVLESIAATRLPVWISTGMSTFAEIDRAVNLVRDAGVDVSLLQCTSLYPTPPERIGLNLIPVLRQRYRCPVGLSDHSGTIYAGLAAATIGIDLLEVHLTLSRDMFGPDVAVSLTPDELAQLVDGVRFIERTLVSPVDKDEMASELTEMRSGFMKSLFAAEDIASGQTLEGRHLSMKKPGTGLAASRLREVVGRRIARSVARGAMLREDDIEWDG